ncbi:MAG: hypothetical protein ACLQNE_35750 [Thermoguttaceae bacterium]
MARRIVFAVLPVVCLAWLAATPAPAADEVLKLVPDSALGFVVVNRLGAVDAKIQELGRQMQIPLPGLMAKLKEAVGSLEGVDENGSAVSLILPPPADSAMPALVLLVPVTDYAKFVGQFQPEDGAAAATKIEVHGSQTWVRSIGGYAAIMPLAGHEAIEEKVKLRSEIPAGLTALRAWSAESDAVAVILPPGIKLLSAKVQQGIRTIKMTFSAMGEKSKQMKSAAAVFDLYSAMFQAAEKEVSAFGLGVQLDQGAIRLTSRTLAVPGGRLARLVEATERAQENLVAGVPEGPFVAAGGGVVSQAGLQALLRLSLDLMKAAPDLYGLNEEQLKKLEASFAMLKGLRSISAVMEANGSGRPIFSNLIAIMRVDHSGAFMANYEKYLKEYSAVVKNSNSLVLQPAEVEPTEVAGRPALQITVKVPSPPGPQPPQFAKMMESMIGPGGKVVAWLAPADEHTVFLGYINRQTLERAILAVRQGKPGLATDSNVLRTAKLLPSGAPLVIYCSPKGTLDFINGLISTFMPPEAKNNFTLPPFAKTPPIGLAAETAPGEVRTTLVVPAEVVRATGEYILKIQRRKSGSPPPATEAPLLQNERPEKEVY